MKCNRRLRHAVASQSVKFDNKDIVYCGNMVSDIGRTAMSMDHQYVLMMLIGRRASLIGW